MRKALFIKFTFVFSIIATGVFYSCNPPRNTTKAIVQHQNDDKSQHRSNPYPVIQQKYFVRPWAGTKWCNGDATGANFELVISPKDSVNVYVGGFNNSKSQVVGKIRGYLIIIDPQKVTLPGGDGILSGTLALSNDHNYLRGSFTSTTATQTDSCKVAFGLSK